MPGVQIILSTVAVLMIAATGARSTPSVQAGNPNILFLLADDQRADTIAAHGNPHIKTPNLDSMRTPLVIAGPGIPQGKSSGASPTCWICSRPCAT